MTADLEAPAMLPMTTFLIANDVPKEHRTAACAAFALWLEQFGEGNAPLALLHLAEALKREQDANAELGKRLASVEALCVVPDWPPQGVTINGRAMSALVPVEQILAALSGGVV
jgi:hypothetical protein